MTRVKKGVNALKSRRNILKRVKGYRFGRKSKERLANEAIVHAGSYAFDHRKDKKSDFRKLWNVSVSSAAKALGTSYSKLIGNLKKADIEINRKMLSMLAKDHPESFKKIVEKVS